MARSATRVPVSPWRDSEEKERERVLKRNAVLQAAVRLFNGKGFHNTSLEEVALALSVTKPTIYHYFSSKDEILFECVRLGLEGIQEVATTVGAQGVNGLEQLRALMRDYALIMTQDFGICVSRTGDHELSAESQMRFRALKREIDSTLHSVVKRGMADHSIARGPTARNLRRDRRLELDRPLV